MAQYTIEEIYAGDKYHVMSDVMQEFFRNGTYRRVGDYNIPNLTLPPKETNIKLGK